MSMQNKAIFMLYGKKWCLLCLMHGPHSCLLYVQMHLNNFFNKLLSCAVFLVLLSDMVLADDILRPWHMCTRMRIYMVVLWIKMSAKCCKCKCKCTANHHNLQIKHVAGYVVLDI